MTTKTCTKCNKTKPLDDYSRHKTGAQGLQSRCKLCDKQSRRQGRTGWSPDQFEAAWESQNGLCAICSKQMERKQRGKSAVNADHCHATKRTRALLCWECNVLLGKAQDNSTILRRAADYLDHHNPHV